MHDDHAHVMQVKLCKANTRGVTIILTASSPPPPLPNLERVVEVGEIFSPSRDHHILEMPHSSPSPSEHVPNEMPQPSPSRTEQVHDEMP